MISRNEMAFMTGVLPSLTWRYRFIGKVASEPTRNKVVLKFSNDTRKATTAAAISEIAKHYQDAFTHGKIVLPYFRGPSS